MANKAMELWNEWDSDGAVQAYLDCEFTIGVKFRTDVRAGAVEYLDVTSAGVCTFPFAMNITGALALAAALGVGGTLTHSAGAAAAAVAQRFGASITEGYEIRVIDEVVDLGSSGAAFDLTEDVPTGAIILSAQANLEDLISATTAVKVGLGISGNEDKYGKTSDLTQNEKIDTIPTHAVLSSAEDIQVYAVDTAGDDAGVIGGSGEEVRVLIVYAALNSLDDAA